MGAFRDFVAGLLKIEGAAVEPVEPDGLEVLAPASLSEIMGWPEQTRLGFAAEVPAGAIPVSLRAANGFTRLPLHAWRSGTPVRSRARPSQRRRAP